VLVPSDARGSRRQAWRSAVPSGPSALRRGSSLGRGGCSSDPARQGIAIAPIPGWLELKVNTGVTAAKSAGERPHRWLLGNRHGAQKSRCAAAPDALYRLR
jgi:hypothetical protein